MESSMSYLLIKEGHAERSSAEGFEDAQRRDHLSRSRIVSASSNCKASISESLTLSALPLSPTNVPRRVYRFCEADSDTERSEYGAPTTSKRASLKQGCQPRPFPKSQCLLNFHKFNIPRDSAELGVPARGRWSPLTVGSAEGVARI